MAGSIRVLEGDCRERLRELPDDSVQCCVSSPPYFGLRDYGVDGQIGLEETPEAFVAELVAVFREVLDPFGGAGTTGLVADRLGRDAVLIELNPGYTALSRQRIASDAGLFADITTIPPSSCLAPLAAPSPKD